MYLYLKRLYVTVIPTYSRQSLTATYLYVFIYKGFTSC